VLRGVHAGDYTGVAVSAAGDINADGIDDVIPGADGGAGGRGEAYLVFGRSP
jgi:hypothetical protein